ncbi:Fpg/Nei family DNA glycosylase [Ornithinimicrobium sp. F0845]|uniref:Fpg/Nei family DNA glycosylase n=1 Tax=Ornithinimicrobium sp. F0845 TaxID=2926412 RepID=UPI001FF55C34|nr:DNA-formamidopyrimidine glycosylase family protein [Ornithinimicrobium sp. F0845]MCK0111508.1 Fpg/Nei family DNA glycosylase [Ornithinimicrobium sp. F0845]
MPEGHTLHRLAGDLQEAYAGGSPSVTSPQGRFAEGAALLDGRVVERGSAWGKLLFLHFEGERILYVHLGLIGTFVLSSVEGQPDPPVTGVVRLRLLDERTVADLRGPMACEVLTPEEAAALVERQGPDPLRPESDPDRAWAKIHASRRSIAELLMDQTVLAGVGNIYRCEVLWRHRIKPSTPGVRVKRATWQTIWEDLSALMPWGVRTGRIITRDEVLQDVADAVAAGEAPRTLDVPRDFSVYQRTGEPCLRCGSRVRHSVVAGRNMFWCGNCQRRT